MKGQITGFKDYSYKEFENKKTGEMVSAGRSFKIYFHNSEKSAGKIDVIKIDPQIWQDEFLSTPENGFFDVEIDSEIERFENGQMREIIKSIALA